MKILYAITDGARTVITLTANKKKAERLAKRFDAYVEEYEDGEFDIVFDHEGESVYKVFYLYGQSRAHAVRKVDIDLCCKDADKVRGFDDYAYVTVWAKDTTSAEKKAADIYSKWNAERLGL